MKELIALAFLLLPLGSCASSTRFVVHVDSFTTPEAESLASYSIESPRAEEDPLAWKEFSTYVHRAMQAQGWGRARDGEEPDFELVVDYGISDPERYEYTTSSPVYGVVGETTSYNTEYNAYSGYQPVETKTPEYGITHYTSETAVGVRYHRHLVLVASKHGADGAPIWQVQARSSGYSHDLRLVFPYMVAAARPYLGRSTGHEVDVTLTENSEEAALIRGES